MGVSQISYKLSDITASSQFGIRGLITVNDLGIDPSRSLAELPSHLLTGGDRIDTDLCQATADSHFTAIGRGGLPPDPSEVFSPVDLWRDQRLTYIPEGLTTVIPPAPEIDRAFLQPETRSQFTEVQGWQADHTGVFHLVIEPVNHTHRDAGAKLSDLGSRVSAGCLILRG